MVILIHLVILTHLQLIVFVWRGRTLQMRKGAVSMRPLEVYGGVGDYSSLRTRLFFFFWASMAASRSAFCWEPS